MNALIVNPVDRHDHRQLDHRQPKKGVPHAAQFLALLPRIQQRARLAFRGERAERRDELVAETIANCWVAYCRLVQRGLADVAYASPLARYAIAQTRCGRRVGSSMNVRDVTSEHAQQQKKLRCQQLDQADTDSPWQGWLVEDRRAGPAETAAARIDFRAWLATLPKRTRQIALLLARGESTQEVARRARLSPARISQMRRELYHHWRRFHGEAA